MGGKRTVLLAMLLFTGGCYEYHTVRPSDAVLQTRVKATISPTQAAELAPVLRDVTTTVSGKLVERTPDRITMEVPLYGAGSPVGGRNSLANRIVIPSSELLGLESRTLSKWRTAVSIGAVIAAVGGTWAVVGGEPEGSDKPGQGTDNAIISLFSIPFSIFR